MAGKRMEIFKSIEIFVSFKYASIDIPVRVMLFMIDPNTIIGRRNASHSDRVN